MGGNTIFSHSIRMLVCGHCGAPIAASLDGGSITCEYCGTAAHIERRDESRDISEAAASPTLSEAERFRRLRAQDGRPLLPPPSIQHLVSGDGHIQGSEEEVLRQWQADRVELSRGAVNFATEKRFYFLTFALYGHFEDQMRIRAMLETALELFKDARLRQIVRCMLARNAVRVGDLQAADEWLLPCVPHSDDIHMDTHYRMTWSIIATARGDFAGVLSTLGQQVPIADECDRICGVIRANALERTGRLDAAVQELIQAAGSFHDGMDMIALDIRKNANLALCPQSAPVARRLFTSGGRSDTLTDIEPSVSRSEGSRLGLFIAGWVFIICGILFLLITLVFFVLGIVFAVGVIPDAGSNGAGRGFEFGFGLFWFLMAGGFTLGSLMFFLPGWFMIKGAKKVEESGL